MDTDTDQPAVGQSVWVIDDSASARKVTGRIVSVATEGLFGAAGSVVVETGRGQVRTVLLSKRGTHWDHTPDGQP
jgi:hypothetical protein